MNKGIKHLKTKEAYNSALLTLTLLNRFSEFNFWGADLDFGCPRVPGNC